MHDTVASGHEPSPGVPVASADGSLDVRPAFSSQLLSALRRFQGGDFASPLPADLPGIEGKIAHVFNEVLDVSARRASEISRVCRVVGKEGKLKQRMSVPGAVGGWADEVQALNTLIDDLVWPTTEVTRAIGAVAKGDLGQAIALEVDGRPLEVEFLHSAQLVNAPRSPMAALSPAHPGVASAAPAAPATRADDVEVPRASGANARNISELFSESAKLEGKRLRVRGQIVKVTAGVLGKTYFRLRDGSSARSEERELVVTSQAEAPVGAVATFEGTLRTQVDVGIGFRYPILLSDAEVIADDAARGGG
jgi:hypothetical protein